MGLFSKKPTLTHIHEIESAIFEAQTSYKEVATTDRPDWFIEAYEKTYTSTEFLVKMERKYPSYFKKPTPSSNLEKINSERKKMEKKFVDRFIISIEKKLLNYSTERGKRNNFNKETDKFRYYAGDFLPETVDYFNKVIKERFSEYL